MSSFSSAADRETGADFIRKNPNYFYPLLDLACSSDNQREHVLSAWILEKYALRDLGCLETNFTVFLEGLLKQSNDSKRRPMAKLLYHYCKNSKRRNRLTSKQIDLIVEVCFSCMLTTKKPAPLAFVMKTHHFFRNHEPWIEGELQAFIEKRLPNSSAGFQSVVRQIS